MAIILQIPQKFKEIFLFQKNVIVKKAVLDSISKIDTIVFDIDGVLIDVQDSFRNAICQTVQSYFKKILKFDGKQRLIHPEEIAYFKMAGGFNNDWELTSAVILFYLWKSEKGSTKNIDDLRSEIPDLKSFCTKTLNTVGGLQQVIEIFQRKNEFKKNIFKQWDNKQITRLFKEIYAGKEKCYNIYHFYPSVTQSDGLYKNEKNIFDKKLKESLNNFSVGILTGRSNEETKIVLEKLKWTGLLSNKQVMTSNKAAGKPNPEGLKKLSTYLKTELGLYIGDIRDDLLTVNNYNNKYRTTRFLSAIVLGGEFLQKESLVMMYLEEGVDFLAKDVNDILKWILKNRM